MPFKQTLIFLSFLLISLAGKKQVFAQGTDQIERVWYNERLTAKIQVYKGTDGKFYGKVTWLKYPLMANGQPKINGYSPHPERRNDPIIGLQILSGFKKAGKVTYEGGTVYDPENGKTYDCNLTYKGTKLLVRGYVGFSMFGKTTTWTLAE